MTQGNGELTKEEIEAKAAAEAKADMEDPDLVTIVVQYNLKTQQLRNIWPENEKRYIVLMGMLQMAIQALEETRLVPKITGGIMKGIAKTLGKNKMPSAAEIEASRSH